MKLDMDLVRAILLQAEAAPPNQFPKIELPEYPEDAITEHIQLLAERGCCVPQFDEALWEA